MKNDLSGPALPVSITPCGGGGTETAHAVTDDVRVRRDAHESRHITPRRDVPIAG